MQVEILVKTLKRQNLRKNTLKFKAVSLSSLSFATKQLYEVSY